jgi:two-component system response regulator AtoC
MPDSTEQPPERREHLRADLLLPLQLYHSKAKRRLATGTTLNVSPKGLLAEWRQHEPVREDQTVRVHIGPPHETWPEHNGFFRAKIRRLGTGSQPRCAVEIIDDPPEFLFAPELIGTHPRMLELKRQILDIAAYGVNVLVRGESGTGKNVVASLVHKYSRRSAAPFVRVNCPSIPDSLLESQLFGHERGAFTDAKQKRPGLFRVADRGTIVLDEISAVPLSVQAKLLQVIEDKAFHPIGARDMVRVDVRIVATSNDHLERKMREGGLREDLFYRLNEMTLLLPPLRERATDVLILSEYFLQMYCTEFRKDYVPLGREVAERFLKYSWPGNVRELENTIKRGVLIGHFDTVRGGHHTETQAHRPEWAGQGYSPAQPSGQPMSMAEARAEAEKRALREALAACQYDRTRAAAALGISYRTLLRRMKKHNLKV